MNAERAYDLLCATCWREKECHEDLQFCDAYLEATEEEE